MRFPPPPPKHPASLQHFRLLRHFVSGAVFGVSVPGGSIVDQAGLLRQVLSKAVFWMRCARRDFNFG